MVGLLRSDLHYLFWDFSVGDSYLGTVYVLGILCYNLDCLNVWQSVSANRFTISLNSLVDVLGLLREHPPMILLWKYGF